MSKRNGSLNNNNNRLFLNRVNTDEARRANPALKITATILNDAQAPSRIDVVYRTFYNFSVIITRLNYSRN